MRGALEKMDPGGIRPMEMALSPLFLSMFPSHALKNPKKKLSGCCDAALLISTDSINSKISQNKTKIGDHLI